MANSRSRTKALFVLALAAGGVLLGVAFWMARTPSPSGAGTEKTVAEASVPVPVSAPHRSETVGKGEAASAETLAAPVFESPGDPNIAVSLREPGKLVEVPIAAEVRERWGKAAKVAAPDPIEDLALIQSMLEVFRAANGVNPYGAENEEIVAGLLGRNAKAVAVLPADLPNLDAGGRLLDRWGTPYRFHPVTSQVMEVISAGPDRAWWTADDLRLPEDDGSLAAEANGLAATLNSNPSLNDSETR